VSITCRDRQKAAAFNAGSERMTGHVGGDAQSPNTGPRTAAFLRFESIPKAGVGFRFDGQIYLGARAIERDTFGQLSINTLGCGDRLGRNQSLFDFLVVQQQCHRFKNWPVLRNGMRPPARSISRRNSGAGEPFSDLPELRFVTVPFAISTRSRSPVSTTSWTPGTSRIGSPTSWPFL